MDDPRLRWFNKYWKKHPPVHMAVAAYLGIGKKAQRDAQPLKDSAGAILGDLLPPKPVAD